MDNAAIAHALFDSMEAGDFARFESLFAPGAVIWHNFEPDKPASVADSAALLQASKAWLRDARYVDRRYLPTPDGVVAQHRLRAQTDAGTIELHIMLHMFIEGGLIRRIEEYFDPAQAQRPLRA